MDYKSSSIKEEQSGRPQMINLAVPFMIMGLFSLFRTVRHARSYENVRDSEMKAAKLKNAFGILAGKSAQIEWRCRMTYKHPILMRLPGLAFLTAGLAILIIDGLR